MDNFSYNTDLLKEEVSKLSNQDSKINTLKKDLRTEKDSYEEAFLKQVKSLYPLFREHSKRSEHWNRSMSFNIGTTIGEVSSDLKEKLVLKNDPDFMEYVCHFMIGSLVLNKKLSCSTGTKEACAEDVFLVIKKTADLIGLDASSEIMNKEFRGKPYQEMYVTFQQKNTAI